MSIDYGFVAPKIDVREEEERERRHDRGEEGNHLKGEHQKSASGRSYKKEWRVDHSTGVSAPQAEPYLSQRATHACPQKHTQTEVSTVIQAQACLQINSAPLTQTRALSYQGATNREVDREKEDGEFLGLFTNKTPQTGLFHIPLNLQTKKGGGMEGEMLMADGRIDGGVEEGSERERAPLLSAYASQDIKDMSTSHTDQSDCLPDDYGVLRSATVDEMEKDDGEQAEEEQEGDTTFIDWDPKNRKLVLPEMAFTKEGGLNWLLQGEKRRENRVGEEEEEEEEVNAMRGKLLLENVFVRQVSEEEAEAQREVERGRERGWEADDILTKWDLVISMDE